MDFICLDVETANESAASVCQVGIAAFFEGAQRPELDAMWYVNPEEPFAPQMVSLHGIDAACVDGVSPFPALHEMLFPFLRGKSVLTYGHFDRVSLAKASAKYHLGPFRTNWLDVLAIARYAWPELRDTTGHNLGAVAAHCGLQSPRLHDALEDARTCGEVFLRACVQAQLDLDEWYLLAEARKRPRINHQDGNPDGHLAGEVVVFTGRLSMTRTRMTELALEAGCSVDVGVTKHTTLVVVGVQDINCLAGKDVSSKHEKARQLVAKGKPIRVVGESDFFELLDHGEPVSRRRSLNEFL